MEIQPASQIRRPEQSGTRKAPAASFAPVQGSKAVQGNLRASDQVRS